MDPLSTEGLSMILRSLAATPLFHFLGNWDIAFVAMAVLVLVATRGRLTYERYQSQVVLPATEPVVELEPETHEGIVFGMRCSLFGKDDPGKTHRRTNPECLSQPGRSHETTRA